MSSLMQQYRSELLSQFVVGGLPRRRRILEENELGVGVKRNSNPEAVANNKAEEDSSTSITITPE